ncbi:MAG: DUF559 domain-containing protein [Solirubrobacterales bacterium]
MISRVSGSPAAEGISRQAALASLVACQHGVVSRVQLLDLGFGDGAISHRIASGALIRVHASVFAVGHAQLHQRGWWMAAVLAGGTGALLSHRSAAALWGLVTPPGRTEDVTVVRGSRRGPAAVLAKRRPGARIAFHQPRSFDPRDRSSCDRIPVTAVPRTLLDLAEAIDRASLRRALEEAERLRLLDPTAVCSLLDRSRGRHGLRPLRSLLTSLEPVAITRSGLEDAFLDLCRRAGLPLPDVNASIAGHEVDAVWRAHGLVVELDGYEYHRTAAAFERDRIRDAQLQVAGYDVLRFTYRRVAKQPREVVATIKALISRRT